ncbi:hypothetical protein ABFS83_14G290700 [Erythranthe nasuta]
MKFLVGMVVGWIYGMIYHNEFGQSSPKPAEAAAPPPAGPPPVDDEEFTVETRDPPPAHFISKIESFSLLTTYKIKKYETREFVAGDHKWKLIIHPEGIKDNNYVSVHLAMTETSSLPANWEVNVIFTIFLLNQISDKYMCFRGKLRRFNQLKSTWGFSKLITKKKLRDESNGYIVDDSCVFGAEVFVVKSERVMECVSLLKVYPQKRQLKIPDLSGTGACKTSEEFSSGDYKWRVLLYPNGNENEKGQSVSIYLECVSAKSFGPHQKLKAEYCMRLKGKNDATCSTEKFSSWFTSSTLACGTHALTRIDKLHDANKGFIVDDCCIVEAEISVQAVV